jgi:prolyl oligopeptidase
MSTCLPGSMTMKYLLCSLLFMTTLPFAVTTDNSDPYLWLEDVGGARALDWVRSRNAITTKELEAQPAFSETRSRLLSIFESRERIPYIGKLGAYFYNFWRDAEHVRGIWRRTSLEEYKKASPSWETVLDLDALAASERENWVWSGADCLHPTYDRCLLSLSRGGGDAVVVREFDVVKKEFVAGGFQLPEGKNRVNWRTRDELFVGADFGAKSLTDSGYPRIVKLWKRGTSLSAATTLFEGKATDVLVTGRVSEHPGSRREFVTRIIDFLSTEHWLLDGKKLKKLKIPLDADMSTFRDQILITLRSDWKVRGKTFPNGALLGMPWNDFLNGDRDFQFLYVPNSRGSLGTVRPTLNHLIVNELDNVRSKIYTLSYDNGKWMRTPLPIPSAGAVGAAPVDEFESDDYFLTVTDFVTPDSLYYATLGKPQYELLKRLPSFFNSEGLQVSQHEAVSKDGTRVPYFQVAKREVVLDGSNPTLLYGYGGFEVSFRPSYSAAVGSAWFERGGVYILANIRGGGEFGPKWHQAALKENRQRAYDDFIAIGEDLIARKVTSSKHLGIMGGSNGGLLMGVMLTQRPDLFGAIVCQVPLLDMYRYHKLLAGASWMGEYGDPDKVEEWAYISRYSPYQNMRPDAKYPRVLFTTSTRDDRVHPGHARKMAAKMLAQGHDFLYYENIEGGHGGAANNAQQAHMNALAYTFLWKELTKE